MGLLCRHGTFCRSFHRDTMKYSMSMLVYPRIYRIQWLYNDYTLQRIMLWTIRNGPQIEVIAEFWNVKTWFLQIIWVPKWLLIHGYYILFMVITICDDELPWMWLPKKTRRDITYYCLWHWWFSWWNWQLLGKWYNIYSIYAHYEGFCILIHPYPNSKIGCRSLNCSHSLGIHPNL